MPARYRVALQGFSEFEHEALTFCFRQAASRVPGYVQVDQVADSDFVVADASHERGAGDDPFRIERVHDTLFIGDKAPPGAAAQLPRPIDPEHILRTLDQMAAQRGAPAGTALPDIVLPLDAFPVRPVPLAASETVETEPAAFRHEPEARNFPGLERPGDRAPAAAAAGQTAADEAPLLPGVPASLAPVPDDPPAMLGDAVARATVEPDRPSAASAPGGPARASQTDRSAAKAAARRASRRARLAQTATTGAGTPRDVLLLDLATEPLALSSLLEAFGFVVHRADSIAAAMIVLQRTPLAAAFLDVAAEDVTGIDGLELCRQIKRREMPLAGAVPAVMLLSDRDSAAGRVRAKLAGCDALLTRPFTRGSTARALESCNVALPADARHA